VCPSRKARPGGAATQSQSLRQSLRGLFRRNWLHILRGCRAGSAEAERVCRGRGCQRRGRAGEENALEQGRRWVYFQERAVSEGRLLLGR